MSGCGKIIIKHLNDYKNIVYDVLDETGLYRGGSCKW